MATARMNYAGFAPSQSPYDVAGQPWAMPGVAPPPPPGQIGPNQGMGNWGSDPFGYTNGSLLQPWTQPFIAPDSTKGGVAAPALTPWSYADFSYNFKAPGGYNATQFQAPGKFTYMDMEAPSPFRAPSASDVEADPAYQARLAGGTRAIERTAAREGNLRGGGTLKGLAKYGQELSSEEYDKIYGRKASEYDRAYGINRDLYTTNRGNAAENYDRNFRTQFDVHNANESARLGAYQASSDVALRGGELGYNIATGTYDRNQANAKAAWDSQQEMARAAAAAANAGNARDYDRAMAEYQMAHDLFRENQGIQWDRLAGMTNLGYGAASQQAGFAGARGGTLADLYTGGANAQAAGTIGGANAWNGALGGIANSAMDIYAMSRTPGFAGGGGAGMPGTPYTGSYLPSRRY